jgi:hypothetical protein
MNGMTKMEVVSMKQEILNILFETMAGFTWYMA